MSKLVIVESPTKAKTITRFLGKEYVVTSSYGHIRDLPKGELGIDTEHGFEPKYVIPTKARKTLNELKSKLKKADSVILATDEDREGEAIAWHLIKALGLDDKSSNNKPTQRIVFHEITKSAIQQAIDNPREINMDLVNAQQARRILDRLVGYKLSPFLWKKIVRGLSAGRVQSVALRLIVEREKEREAFKPQEHYSVEAKLQQRETDAKTFNAYLYSKNGKTIGKLDIKSQKKANEIVNQLKSAHYTIGRIEQKEVKRNPLPPFTTSTLQQASSARFGYSAKRTMMLAQNLYERGFITYHRTDSLNLANSALENTRSYIQKKYGAPYLPPSARVYKTRSKGAQEAHEAIRPSSPEKSPDTLKLESPQLKLYTLIWQHLVASQMTPALFASSTFDISTGTPYDFRATGSVRKFDGFTKVYPMKIEENELPALKKEEVLDLQKLEALQHFTQPPPRYSEATLVKTLEKHGIGRPSTYASIISTIQERNYVIKNEAKRLETTEIGGMVTDLLTEHFPRIIDIEFTARMEAELDEVAKGKKDWKKLLDEFYGPFEKNLENKYEEVEKKVVAEETDKKCPDCGKTLLKRMGRFGWFYACSGFPECRHTESLENPENALNVHCPKCVEGKITEKRTKRGKIFYGCNRYPDCDFALWYKPVVERLEGKKDTNRIVKCPDCETGVLVEKKDKIVCSEKECKYVKKT